MKSKELQLLRILDLKYQSAEARVTRARSACLEIDAQIETVRMRRSVQPSDPEDQLNHERHIGWLDQRSRELLILAAKAAAEFNLSKDALSVEFGRKAALAKALKNRSAEDARRGSGQ